MIRLVVPESTQKNVCDEAEKMAELNLRNLDGLKRACTDARDAVKAKEWYETWGRDLQEFLQYIRDADLTVRASKEFQTTLWDENPISAVGQGNVSVDDAIDDPDFRLWIAEASLAPLPKAGEARTVALRKLYEEIEARVAKFTNRIPRLKIHRVLAGLFPKDFTTVSHQRKLRKLRVAIIGNRKDAGPSRHRIVLQRLKEALGPTGDNFLQIADRMRLPWLLYSQFVASTDDEATEETEERPGTEKLIPLPAARRRRGLTGVSGGFPAVMAILAGC